MQAIVGQETMHNCFNGELSEESNDANFVYRFDPLFLANSYSGIRLRKEVDPLLSAELFKHVVPIRHGSDQSLEKMTYQKPKIDGSEAFLGEQSLNVWRVWERRLADV